MKRPLVPMMARIGTEKDLDKQGCIFEPKLDGIRALCYVEEGLTFYSRNGIDITKDYPEFQFRDSINAESALLDGEIVAYDEESRPRFSLWQKGYETHYIVFDILSLNGESLLDKPLHERKEILDRVVSNSTYLEKCIYTIDGHALYAEMRKRSMEGVMAKEIESRYYPAKRSKVWTKIKAYNTLEAIIIGYTTKKRQLSSLVVGMYTHEGELRYIGKVGTGFTQKLLAKIYAGLEPLKVESPVHKNLLKEISKPTQKNLTWVKPQRVCEIKYLEFTDDGILRTPVFLRMRPDKDPKEITFEEQEIKIDDRRP